LLTEVIKNSNNVILAGRCISKETEMAVNEM